MLYQFGAYQLYAELLRALFLDGEDKPPRLKRDDRQAFTLNALSAAYAMSGQPRRAVPIIEMANVIDEKRGGKKGFAIGLGNVSQLQLVIGALSVAERNLRREIDLSREIAGEFDEAIGHQELGHVLCYRGEWQEAKQTLDIGLKLFGKQHIVQSEGIIWSHHALRFLLMAREEAINDTRKSNNEYRISAIESAQRALELADEFSRTDFRVERDYVRAHWLLGAAYCANNELTLAEENLSKALNLCRKINVVETEAEILLDLARLSFAYALRSAPGSAQDELFKEAQEKASEALVITERSGYVLQGADVHLFLAEMAMDSRLEIGDWKTVAKRHAEEALRLARCEGPPYYYKVAYEEAERLLASLS